ncbi:MAG TPA: M28 family peptidase, partial [Thermoanaerobaculia bacterium]|nr:M28 family peptidase [Thermoanaerobaculia bacterium]
ALLPAIRAMERPAASSLFYTIYELLPNDTDVTVFKRAGLQAVNFGAIGNVEYYHTPLDDLAHLDPRTLQHHGDNVLAVARSLDRGLDRRPENAVFFDVLNIGVVAWPERWTLWIALLSLALLLLGGRNESWRALLIGAALTVLCLVTAAALAFVLVWLAHLRAGSFGRVAFPQPALIAMWLAGIAAALLAFALSRRHDRRGVYIGAGLIWHVLSVALSASLPGTAFLFLLPAVGFTLSIVTRAPAVVAALLPAVLAGTVFFPLTLFLYPALGKTSLIAIAVIVAITSSTVVPMIDRLTFRFGAAVAATAVAAALTSLAFPTFTAGHPQRRPITHELEASTVHATAEKRGDVTVVRIVSERKADRVTLDFEDRVEVLRVNGTTPAPRNPGRVWRGGVTIHASEAVVELRAAAGTEVVVSDLTYGLPDQARAEAENRDAAGAVTSHRGDVTVSRTKLRI